MVHMAVVWDDDDDVRQEFNCMHNAFEFSIVTGQKVVFSFFFITAALTVVQATRQMFHMFILLTRWFIRYHFYNIAAHDQNKM